MGYPHFSSKNVSQVCIFNIIHTIGKYKKWWREDMGFMDMFNPDAIMEAATGVANQMMAATTSLVDKLMSSVLLG